jgi:hypothetical protein
MRNSLRLALPAAILFFFNFYALAQIIKDPIIRDPILFKVETGIFEKITTGSLTRLTYLGNTTIRRCEGSSLELSAISGTDNATRTYQWQVRVSEYETDPLNRILKEPIPVLEPADKKFFFLRPPIITEPWINIPRGTDKLFKYTVPSTGKVMKTELRCIISVTSTLQNTTITTPVLTIIRESLPVISNFTVDPYYCPGNPINIDPDIRLYGEIDKIEWQQTPKDQQTPVEIYKDITDGDYGIELSIDQWNNFDYKLAAANSCGTAKSNTVRSFVPVALKPAYDETVSIADGKTEIYACLGSSLTLDAKISNKNEHIETATYSYTWYRRLSRVESSFTEISHSTHSAFYEFNSATGSLTIKNQTADLNGYQYKVRLNGLCKNPESQIVTVRTAQPATITAINMGIDTVCAGQEIEAAADITGTGTVFTSWAVKNTPPSTFAENGSFTFNAQDGNTEVICWAYTQYCPQQTQLSAVKSVYSKPAATASASKSDCAGDAQVVTVSVTGGKKSYTYIWADASTEPYMSPAAQGSSYYVTVTDACGSSTAASATVAEAVPLRLEAIHTDISCSGYGNGTAAGTIFGGVKPYSYNISASGQTNDIWIPAPAYADIATATALGTGGYTLSASDACEDTVRYVFEIKEPLPLIGNISEVQHASCPGSGDGAIHMEIAGGTMPYSVRWSNGQQSASPQMLFAGRHNATIADAKGCISAISIDITEPAPLWAGGATVGAKCFGLASGSIEIQTDGGKQPIKYAWADGAESGLRTELAAGQYELTVTDACGTQKQMQFNVSQPEKRKVEFSTSDISCAGRTDGYATATITGGFSPVTMLWSNGARGTHISNLAAGKYYLTVTDPDCSSEIIDSVTITEPLPISINTSKIDISCHGAADGEALAEVAGGTAPYQYAWSNGLSAAYISPLFPGSYTVNVFDKNMCAASAAVQISQPGALAFSVSTSDAPCFGQTGSALLNGLEDSTGLVFSWKDTAGSILGQYYSIQSLAAGRYTVSVADTACGDTLAKHFEISQPEMLSAAISHKDASCYGKADGQAAASASGGVKPYKYIWGNGETQEVLSNLSSGQYSLTVSDACAHTVELTVQVAQPEMLQLEVTKTDISCHGAADGEAQAAITGGQPPYIYNWSNGSKDATVSNLYSGLFTVNVYDSKGCAASQTVQVWEPGALKLRAWSMPASCGNADGKLLSEATGGTLPYTYKWSNGADSSYVENVEGNKSYSLSITDSKQCHKETSVKVEIEAPRPAICLVTVDKESGKNLVAWEKDIKQPITGFNVYAWRAGRYHNIANVPISEFSQHIDMLSTPRVAASRYAVTSVDKCGNESELSPGHQTIQLGVSVGFMGDVVLNWTPYIDESGDFVPAQYHLYKGRDMNSLNKFASVSVGTEYNDLIPGDALVYAVAAEKNTSCYTDGRLKSDSGPYSQSLSNLAEAIISSNKGNENCTGAKVYPNPGSGGFYLSADACAGAESIEVYSAAGQLVWQAGTGFFESGEAVYISLPQGFYIINVISADAVYKLKATVE